MGIRRVLDRESLGALVLALAIPLLFIDERHEPVFEFDVGSRTARVAIWEIAVAVVLFVALVIAVRIGTSRLGAARILWIPGFALAAWLAFEALRPASFDDARFEHHLVDYAELTAYALVAVAVPLLVRRSLDLTIVVVSLVLWSLVATGLAVAQLLGADILDPNVAGHRQPSFLTVHDLAALSALALGIATGGILATRRRMPAPRLFAVALVAGVLGFAVAGSVAALAGFVVGTLVALVAARGRFGPAAPSGASLVGLAAVILVVALGVTSVRTDAAEEAVQRAGLVDDEAAVEPAPEPEREVLMYIGLREFKDNPILGVGWQRSGRLEIVEEYLEDAHERYPDATAESFPTAAQEQRTPNAYVQLLAEGGAITVALVLLIGVGGLVLSWRTATYASTPWAAGAGLATMCALGALAAEWALVSLVPGSPLQAATALTLGLAAAGAATVEEESGG
jgi:O-antigen ligase